MAHRITLLTRTGCHLCDDAREVVRRIAGSDFDETDVDADPALRAEYGDLVPVVLIDGKEHGYWRIEEPRLRRALSR
jgi:glutaredoxin